MSFTGDLEHLPIVDVIQLLHATRKSGTLGVQGRRGECELVFHDGFIVSANHSQNMVRIGQILVEMNAIASDLLEQILQEQAAAGKDRRPLVAMLIEGGHVSRDEAFRGLETLIELSIVDILTWTTGTFSLDVDKIVISDEYRYFPEKLQQQINVNTQNALMDALRIYDEKKRDGQLVDEGEDEAEAEATFPPGGGGQESRFMSADDLGLSADDLGLADLDRLEKRIPGVFSGLADLPAEPGAARRQEPQIAGDLSPAEQAKLRAFLQKFAAGQTAAGAERSAQAVILFSPDELLRYGVVAVCKHSGILVFTTDDEKDLDPIIDQSLAKKIVPVLVYDCPQWSLGGFGEEQIVRLRQRQKKKFPQVPIFQLASPLDLAFSLQALSEGVRAVFPRPLRNSRPEFFIDDFTHFLECFRRCLDECGSRREEWLLERLQDGIAGLRSLREAPEIAFALLKFVAGMFERALTLVVGPTELIAERTLGVGGRQGAAPLGLRIPLAKPSVFRQVIQEGRPFFGASDDAVLTAHLHAAIGAPLRSTILLLPISSRGKTICLTYADFGSREVAPIPLDLLQILAGQASLVLENAFYRKKLESSRA